MCAGCQILSQQPRPDYRPGPGLPRQKGLPRLEDLPNADHFLIRQSSWAEGKGKVKAVTSSKVSRASESNHNSGQLPDFRQSPEAVRVTFASIWVPQKQDEKTPDTPLSSDWIISAETLARWKREFEARLISEAFKQNAPKYRCLKINAHKAPCSILDLPPELILLIFKRLDICASVCLGLTCKALFNYNEHLHPFQVSLHMRTQPTEDIKSKKCLGHLLTEWMKPKYTFDHSWGKFLQKKHYKDDPEEVERRWKEKETWPRIRIVADKGGALIAFKSNTRGLR